MGNGIYKKITYRVLNYDGLSDEQIFDEINGLRIKMNIIDVTNPGLFGMRLLKEILLEFDEIVMVYIKRHGDAEPIYNAFNQFVSRASNN